MTVKELLRAYKGKDFCVIEPGTNGEGDAVLRQHGGTDCQYLCSNRSDVRELIGVMDRTVQEFRISRFQELLIHVEPEDSAGDWLEAEAAEQEPAEPIAPEVDYDPLLREFTITMHPDKWLPGRRNRRKAGSAL